jgi:hypothetical protein
MTVYMNYKGLSPEDRIFGQSPESSAVKAKGTMYEAWFDVLQTSPWYRKVAETGEFPSDQTKRTWDYFGDLRNITFRKWWLKTGYMIFAERVPYRPIQVSEDYDFSEGPKVSIKVKSNENQNAPSILKIEVPLNLSPAALKRQFDEILRKQAEYVDSYNRWDHSTAPVHQYRETKLNYATIKKWMYVYQEYEKRKDQEGFKLYNFAKELDLHPTLFVGLVKNADVPQSMRVDAANAASEILKSAKNLMANATEGFFPCTDSHNWAISNTRERSS